MTKLGKLHSVNHAPKCIKTVERIQQGISEGSLNLEAVIRQIREVIDTVEPKVRAWQSLDWSAVDVQCNELESRSGWQSLPLAGVPVAVKDIYDTLDFITTYGSSIYERNQPVNDAALVATLRSLGAIIIGKTVTTEFAFWQAGPTSNPYNKLHTPGGSSSGSAAAVATGMVPFALGSQTAASTIRPAAYCGIFGFKPSYGLLPLDGVKPLAPSLDTAGLFANSISDLEYVMKIIYSSLKEPTLNMSEDVNNPANLVLAPLCGQILKDVDKSCTSVVDVCFAGAKAKGCRHSLQQEFNDFEELTNDQINMMAAESVESFEKEINTHNNKLSEFIKTLVADGAAINSMQKQKFQKSYADAKNIENNLFGDADVLICPSSTSTAPLKENGTGNPLMSRAFTFLGLPSLSIPQGVDYNGLPIGVQAVARKGNDLNLLAFAKAFLI